MTPALLLALAAVQQVSLEDAIAEQRAEVRAAMRIDCPPGAEDEDNRVRPAPQAEAIPGGDGDPVIVVCGRGGGGSEGYRIPYVPEPGRIARLPGEAPSGRDALAADRCLRLCNEGVKFDVIGAIRAIERGLDRLLHPD